MFDHVALHVTHLENSTRFFAAALAPLGIKLRESEESYGGFGPESGSALWLYLNAQHPSARVHLALSAPNRASVDSFYAAGIKAGGTDNGAPGLRTNYGPTYYAAFLIAPDGHNIEAVCLK